MGKKHIEYKVLPRKVKKLADLENPDFLERNPDVRERITSAPDGTAGVFRFQGTDKMSPIDIGRRFSMDGYSHLCFKVYNEKATGTNIRLKLNLVPDNDREIQGGVCKYDIRLDFEGWKEFRILRDHITVAYPPPFFTSFSLITNESGMNSDIPENVLYFTSITAENEEIEVVSNGFDLNDPQLYEGILTNYEQIYTGTPDVWDTPQQKNRVAINADACRKHWAEFKETWCEGEKGKLFGYDIQRVSWRDEANITNIYSRLFSMACAYARYGSEFYKNEELLCDIKNALEYMHTYYYGENLYTSTIYGNWWHWDIGIPERYVPILVLLRRELGHELVAKYAKTIKFLLPFPSGAGSNKINIANNTLAAAALLRDAKYICLTKHFMMNDLGYYVDTYGGDGGFFEDGSFIQHTNHPYIQAYGASLLHALTWLMNSITDTPFEFTDDVYLTQFRWIFENYRPQLFCKNFSACNGGRAVSRGGSEISSFEGCLRQMILMRSYAPNDLKPKFDSLIRAFMLNLKDDMSYKVWPNLINYCTELYRDESVIPEQDYLTTRVFTRMARIAHHSKNYGAALAMSSDTIHKYESINNENQQGWYFSDGFLYIYTYKTGYDFGKAFFQHSNPYLRPAVTANSAKRKAINTRSYPNGSSHAGGVEFGKYGSAAFVLKCYDSIMAHGTHEDVKDTKITANKSYFFFDNEIVCLGSDIRDISGTPVITCVDNRLWREGDTLSINGKKLVPTEKTELTAKYAHFTNMGGYVFLNEAKLSVNKNTCANYRVPSDESVFDFMELNIEHGIGSEALNGQYAYVYLPEQAESDTEKYAENPDVTIVKQTDTAHAVRENSLNILAINFFDADEVQDEGITVTAKSPCSVMLCGDTLSVSDPTKYQSEINLTITKDGKTAEINVPVKGSMGKTFSYQIKSFIGYSIPDR